MSDSLFSKRYFYPVAGGIFCLVMACVPTILELAAVSYTHLTLPTNSLV